MSKKAASKEQVREALSEVLDGLSENINGALIAVDTEESTCIASFGKGGTVFQLIISLIESQVEESPKDTRTPLCEFYKDELDKMIAKERTNDDD